MVCRKLTKSLFCEDIADQLEIEISKVQDICKAANPYAPNYDIEKITKQLLNKD